MKLDNLPQLIQNELVKLPQGLLSHIDRARSIGKEISTIHRIDFHRVDLAIATHDLAKNLSETELIDECKQMEIEISPDYHLVPKLLHGPVAAFHLNEYISEDISLFNSIRWHTSGNKNFDTENKIVFMSDKIDPNKINKRPELNKIKDLAYKNLDHSIIEFFETQFDYLTKNNIDIHPESKKYYEYLT